MYERTWPTLVLRNIITSFNNCWNFKYMIQGNLELITDKLMKDVPPSDEFLKMEFDAS